MPQVLIEVAFSVGASTGTLLHLDDPTRGLLDTATLGTDVTEDPVWRDISSYADAGEITTRRGSSRVDSPVITYDAGTATIPLNNADRRFDPSNLDGPYVDATSGNTQVTAMRAVRVRAVWDGTTYDLFRGTADEWDVAWSDPGASTTTLTATDAFKILTGIDRSAAAAVGAGERTGTRINRILTDAGWDADDRDIATGDSTVQATTLESGVLPELQLTADSEIGELYVDGAGRLTFRNRNALLQDARSNTTQAVFGDEDGELPYRALGQSTDDTTFYNEVAVTRAGGAEQVVTDAASQALFYRRTYRPSTQPILETDAAAYDYASWLLHVASEPELRFTEITIEPTGLPDDLWPQALGREIGDRITILRRPPGGGDPIEHDCFIRGITHSFTATSWTTAWTLQSADRYGSFLVLDDPVLGRLSSGNALAY